MAMLKCWTRTSDQCLSACIGAINTIERQHPSLQTVNTSHQGSKYSKSYLWVFIPSCPTVSLVLPTGLSNGVMPCLWDLYSQISLLKPDCILNCNCTRLGASKLVLAVNVILDFITSWNIHPSHILSHCLRVNIAFHNLLSDSTFSLYSCMQWQYDSLSLHCVPRPVLNQQSILLIRSIQGTLSHLKVGSV